MAVFKHILCLDLEAVPNGEIFHIGALFDKKTFERKNLSSPTGALAELDEFATGAQWLLGHNISRHDIPLVREHCPTASFLDCPLVDTLFLSPLAFPENPYHKLVKDYKLLKTGKNNPVADARLSIELLRDQVDAFTRLQENNPDLLQFYAAAFALEKQRENGVKGNYFILKGMAGGRPDTQTAKQIFMDQCRGKACPRALKRVWDHCWDHGDRRPALAFLVSWIRVAGGNSILPPWVAHEFPLLGQWIHRLRYTCGEADCPHCKRENDAPTLLKRYFGFESYRPLPDGTPLQQDIVEAGLAGKSHLAILPTGGGKSICYQIPALHRFHRTGELTIVISPLKALMKDQVDNLNRTTGSEIAATINGSLTLPERGAVIERVQLGDVGLLYISPEQLRNKSIADLIRCRKIGYWIFDEAHCLSKWGHDFRPDYLHVTEFISREAARTHDTPRIGAFTATAKKDVLEEILEHFQSTLDQELLRFEGGVHRENLELWVRQVNSNEKFDQISQCVKESLDTRGGAAIVYCARRKTTERLARFLQEKGIQAHAFHAGLREPDKQQIQDDFAAGQIPVICATNAFGMGIDKQDIRLVVHGDIPGSLENYLQEAGRAGRDQKDSDCILLYEPDDIDQQFSLTGRSRVTQKEIQKVLRLLRKKAKRADRIIITPGELMESIGRKDDDDTKARIAVSWLERKGFVSRDFNKTLFFKGSPRVKSMEEAEKKMDRLHISRLTRSMYTLILEYLYNAESDDLISADQLSAALGRLKNLPEKFKDSRQIMVLLSDMEAAGLIREGAILTAFIRPRGKNNAPALLEEFIQVETAMVGTMEELSPEAGLDPEHSEVFHLRRMAQRLKEQGFDKINTDTPRRLLRALAADRGKSRGKSLGILGRRGMDQLTIQVKFPWETVKKRMAVRHLAARILVQAVIDQLPREQQSSRGEILAEFFISDLIRPLASPTGDLFDQKITTALARTDHMAMAESTLLYLHGLGILTLQNGLGVFRQAFTLMLDPHSRGRRYSQGDYQALSHHYDQKNAQIHVMEKFARIGIEKKTPLYAFIQDYFSFPFDRFTARYFPGEKKIIKTAMTGEAYRRIIQSLDNPVQEALTAAPPETNLLVLAGPGSGKTRTIVHRCAWLIKAQSIPPEAILVLCFNHRAMLELRRRIQDLAGAAGRDITVMTYHGFAMRLTGHSLLESQEVDFNPLIREATAILNGDKEVVGMDPAEAREYYLAGFRYILVDEYQDIDQDQYRFISALTGRLEEDGEAKISIMAVGDDDQSIYKFRNANLKFIHQFREDFQADPTYLLENYRSSHPIVAAANAFISQNRERMKTDHPCRVDKGRKKTLLPPDQIPGPEKIQIVHTQDPASQAVFVAKTIQELVAGPDGLDPSRIAVVSRTGLGYPALVALRMALAQAGIPFSRTLKPNKGFPLFRIREIRALIRFLEEHQTEALTPNALERRYENRLCPDNPWSPQIRELLTAWSRANGDTPITLSLARDFMVELLLEERRDHRMGKGVFMGTVHSVKGMEFPVVFILDGGWTKKDMEEERRLFYVGMTRAETRLFLMGVQKENPHLPFLEPSPFCRVQTAPEKKLKGYSPGITISTIGMEDIFLSYPGFFHGDHPLHRHLTALEPGQRVRLEKGKNRLAIKDGAGVTIAQLSSRGSAHWEPLLPHILSAQVIAMVHRTPEDGQTTPAPAAPPKVDSWEIPIVEILHYTNGYR